MGCWTFRSDGTLYLQVVMKTVTSEQAVQLLQAAKASRVTALHMSSQFWKSRVQSTQATLVVNQAIISTTCTLHNSP